jgi:hydroxymethylpyrimidine pyrophosphatase-like HAD family hydrolase
LFDVDGVLTDPELKRVTQSAIFDELLRRLVRDEPVGFNTGRSLPFIVDQVLAPLERRAPSAAALRDVVAVGEKGGVWVLYDENGTRTAHVDATFAVPRDLQDEVREVVRRPPFAETMFYDETKQTMVSVELRPGRTVAEFARPQQQLVVALTGILARRGLRDEFNVDATRIATDVEHRRVGKAYATGRFTDLLAARGLDPRRFVCFGDSPSDHDMLIELLRLGKVAEFVFVGGEAYLTGKDLRFVTFTRQLCDHGTLAHLRALD